MLRILTFLWLCSVSTAALRADDAKQPAEPSDDPASVVAVVKLGAELVSDKRGRVERLRLPHATDRSLAHLKGLRGLRYLDLAGSPVTDAGMQHLADVGSLEEVDLSRTRITNAGLEHLQRLARLRSLRVDRTSVTYAGIARLKKAIGSVTVTPQVQSLDGVSFALEGVRHHPKKKSLLIRIQYWGKGVASLNYGEPTIVVDDGKRFKPSSPG